MRNKNNLILMVILYGIITPLFGSYILFRINGGFYSTETALMYFCYFAVSVLFVVFETDFGYFFISLMKILFTLTLLLHPVAHTKQVFNYKNDLNLIDLIGYLIVIMLINFAGATSGLLIKKPLRSVLRLSS